MTATEQNQSSDYRLDNKDIQILKLLQDNAKLTVREIARTINLSTTPTHDRIKRLEENGVIKGYAALLNNKLVNKHIIVICLVSLKDHSKETARQFIRAVQKFPKVIECYNISGDFDFQLKIIAESMDDYHSFYLNELSEVKGIGQTRSSFVMNVIKETHCVI